MKEEEAIKKIELTDIEKAKALILAEEKKQGDAAVAILKKAIEEIDKLGFAVVPCGAFNGNAMKASIQVLKKV